MTDKKMPEKKFRIGGLNATVWENTKRINGKDVPLKTVVIERRYKDANGEWQSSNSFTANDLPKLQLVASKAFEYLVSGEDNAADAGEEPV